MFLQLLLCCDLGVGLVRLADGEIDREDLDSVVSPFLPESRAVYLFWPSLHFDGLHNVEIHSDRYRFPTQSSDSDSGTPEL